MIRITNIALDDDENPTEITMTLDARAVAEIAQRFGCMGSGELAPGEREFFERANTLFARFDDEGINGFIRRTNHG